MTKRRVTAIIGIMTYIANLPNVYEEEEVLERLLAEANIAVYTGSNTRRAIERKKVLVRLRGGKCEKCGYNKNVAALVFHHTGEKTFNASSAVYRFTDRQFNEICIPEIQEHTILLCATCHAEEHNRNCRR